MNGKDRVKKMKKKDRVILKNEKGEKDEEKTSYGNPFNP